MILREPINSLRRIDFMNCPIKDSTQKVYLVLHNVKIHHGRDVTPWLEKKKDNIKVFYLPAYSPELNPR